MEAKIISDSGDDIIDSSRIAIVNMYKNEYSWLPAQTSPAGHETQLPDERYHPDAHVVHAVAPATPCPPLLHDVQRREPVVAAYDPAAHWVIDAVVD